MGPCDSLARQPIVYLMGQCELGAQILRWYGPMRQSRAAAHCVLDGPMRANCPNIMMIWAHATVSCGSPLCAWWANESQLPKYYDACNGPMRTNCPNATMHATGPCNSLARQPNVYLMGQCELIAQILWWYGPMRQSRAAAHCVFDGPMRANCQNTMMHAMGQCELIAQMLRCMQRAHATVSRGSPLCTWWANES